MESPEAQDLSPYSQLYGAGLVEHPQHGPCFICEGRTLVTDALKAAWEGKLQAVSLLTTPRQASDWIEALPEDVPLWTLPDTEMESLLGFSFHRGVLACFKRPDPPSVSELQHCKRILVLPQVDQQDNLGLLIRSAASLGTDAILLGRAPEVFSRRVVKLSMGGAWRIPIFRQLEPWPELRAWKQAQDGEIVGAALHGEAMDAAHWMPAARCALVLGPEAQGLDHTWIRRCDRTVTIPMARDMDSMNVAAAGAILLWKMRTS